MRLFFDRLTRAVYFLESSVLVILLITIISLSVADIFMRNVFGSGVSVAAPIVRILVLWLGLLGALYATRKSKHITVDVLARLLSSRAQRIASSITTLFSAAVCFLVAWHAFAFVRDTWSYGDTLLDDVPAWLVQSIIPFSFFCIGLRFFAHSLGHVFVTGYTANHTPELK